MNKLDVCGASADAITDSYKAGNCKTYRLDDIFGSTVAIANSYSNFTPRKNAYMTFCDQSDGHIVVYGTKCTFTDVVNMWDNTFFSVDKDVAIKRFSRRLKNHFGSIDDHQGLISDMSKLHDLGYLPLEVRAIDEGTKYPIGLPVFTVKATVDGFSWLVNYVETITSGLIWPMINTATKIEQFFLQAKHYGELSAPTEVVDQWLPICVHEFGLRGYWGPEAGMRTSSCHNLFFLGSDTIGTIDFFEHYYGADSDTAPIAVSVRASEHADISRMLSLFRHIAQKAIDEDAITHKCVAVMKTAEEQANFKISTLREGECVKGYRGGYFENIDEDPAEVFPIHVDPQDVLDNTEFYVLKYFVDNSTGIMSYVSDTENYYRLLNEYGAQLKGAIEAREGREDGQPPIFVFRPDSSRRTPLTVICGYQLIDMADWYDPASEGIKYDSDVCMHDSETDQYFLMEKNGDFVEISKEEAQGSLISLWNTFGGAEVETPAGLMKLINPAVGLIYGEAISQKHQKEIYERMIEMGFSAVNVLMGKGSYASLENSTRDLFSMSYKQTFSEAIIDGERVNLEQQKTPMGDMSKKSAKGLLCVPYVDPLLGFVLEQEVSEEREQEGCLTLLLRNGVFYKNQTLDDIKANYASNTYYHLEK